MIKLSMSETQAILEFVDGADYLNVTRLLGLGEVRLRRAGPSGSGLLSIVDVLEAADGGYGIAVKRPVAAGTGIPSFLDPSALAINEVNFYLSAAEIADAPLPLVLAVSQDLGLIVMRQYSAVADFEQVRGVDTKSLLNLCSELGRLHAGLSQLRSSDLGNLSSSRRWDAVALAAERSLPAFLLAHADVEDRDVWRWWTEASVARIYSGVMGWASSHSWTIASMDMRSDNIMGSAEAPIFLDWQFAERAPGGFDLATLLSTSSDCDYDEALHAIAAYATGAGPAGSDSRDEFVVGLLARTLFAIPVVTLLSHPTPSSRVARDAAIRRLKRLLTYFQDEAFDVIGWV